MAHFSNFGLWGGGKIKKFFHTKHICQIEMVLFLSLTCDNTLYFALHVCAALGMSEGYIYLIQQ